MSEPFSSEFQDDISKWVEQIFGANFKVEIESTTEKGDGYLGDIVFIKIQKQEIIKRLVIKCSKRSEALRQKVPIRNAFKNEIYMYETVFPIFKSFETKHGISNHFDNFPAFFGSYFPENAEVLILENLKDRNYFLHDRRMPMSKNYIELILNAYGHFHALSAAYRDQYPEDFENLSGNLTEFWCSFCKACDLHKLFSDAISETYDLLNGKIPENMRKEWKKFGEHVEEAIYIVGEKDDRFTVIVHGDCWNNNFMFQGTESDPNHVAIIDWQVASLSTPIIDLSYFLISCLPKDCLKNIPDYLRIYYKAFSKNLHDLGSDPEKMYSYNQLEQDWKRYSRFGIMLAPVGIKVSLTEKEDCKDLEEIVKQGGQVSDTFKTNNTNEKEYLGRMKELVEYVFDNRLIETSLE